MNEYQFKLIKDIKDRFIESLCSISWEYGSCCNNLEELIKNDEIKKDDIELIKNIEKEFLNENSFVEKDCSNCYHNGDFDYCEYCIRGEGYSKDYWEIKQ